MVLALHQVDGFPSHVQRDIRRIAHHDVQRALKARLVDKIDFRSPGNGILCPVDAEQFLPFGIVPAVEGRRRRDGVQLRSEAVGVHGAGDLMIDADRTRKRIDFREALEHPDLVFAPEKEDRHGLTDGTVADLNDVVDQL